MLVPLGLQTHPKLTSGARMMLRLTWQARLPALPCSRVDLIA